VSREETLARREKFQKIGWLPPNHKPKTKKVIATAKRLWDKYLEMCHRCARTPPVVNLLHDVELHADFTREEETMEGHEWQAQRIVGER